MNHKSLYLVLTLFLLLTAGSCYTGMLTLSVLQPADTVLPASVKRLSVIPMPGVTIRQDSNDNDNFYHILGNYEVKMGMVHGLHSVFSESPRFSKVVLSDTNVASFFRNSQVFWEDLEKVCRHDTTDVVLLLSRFTANEAQFMVSPYLGNFKYRLINQTRWIFYYPEKQQTLAHFKFTDTVEIPQYYTNLSHIIYWMNFTNGKLCGKRLAPYWTDVSRMIYTRPGKDLKDAAEFALQNKWRNAGLLWNDLVTDKHIKIASRAAFNLSLAFEREDDLEQAFLWAAYSDSLKTTELSSAYLKIISDRIKKQERLDRQMTGN